MLKKIVLGVAEGAFIGGLVFFLLSRLHMEWTALLAYFGAILVGALVGAVAGKPIWAREAKLEAMLKSLTGAFIAATALFGARKWLSGVHVNLDALGQGSGAIGQVPAASLPIIGSALGFVFQIDDALGSEEKGPHARVEAAKALRVEAADEDGIDETETRARRKE